MKTVQDYLSDPRILNAPDMVEALEPVKEIHAVRLKIHGETAGMSTAKKVEFLNKEATAFLAPMGKSLCYGLAGRGNLQPGATTGV